MTYNDQEDDTEEWLRQQAAAANIEPAQQQPAAGVGGGEGPWSRARELMERQSQMQYKPSQNFSAPKAEAAPDRGDWKTILAMGLDLLANKGRNAGNIAMKGEELNNQRLAQWKDQNGPDAMMRRRLQASQLQQADRAGFDKERAQLGQQIEQERAMAGAQVGQQNADRTFTASRDDHDDQLAQNALTREQSDEHFAGTQGLTREQMAQAKGLSEAQMAQTRSLAGAQMAQAREFEQGRQNEALNARADAAAARERGYGHEDAAQERSFQHQDQTQSRALQTQKDVFELSHPAPVAPKGYKVAQGQEQQFRQAMSGDKTRNDILTGAGNAAQIQENIAELKRLREAPSSEANKRLYDATIKTLIGDRSEEGSTGVLSGTEFERYVKDLPEYGVMGNFSTWRGARDMLMKRDPALETLDQFGTRFKASNLQKMSPYGLVYADEEQADPTIQRFGMRAK